MPICVAGLLALDERDGGLLGGLQAVRRDIGRAHAARHVDRQDDRRLVRRHADDRHRARQGDDQAGQRRAMNSANGQMPPQLRARQRRAHQRQARIAYRETPPPPQHPDIGRDQQRDHHQEQDRKPGHRVLIRYLRSRRIARDRVHAASYGTRPNHRSEQMPPISITSMPAPAKSAVTSVRSGLTTNCEPRFS